MHMMLNLIKIICNFISSAGLKVSRSHAPTPGKHTSDKRMTSSVTLISVKLYEFNALFEYFDYF